MATSTPSNSFHTQPTRHTVYHHPTQHRQVNGPPMNPNMNYAQQVAHVSGEPIIQHSTQYSQQQIQPIQTPNHFLWRTQIPHLWR